MAWTRRTVLALSFVALAVPSSPAYADDPSCPLNVAGGRTFSPGRTEAFASLHPLVGREPTSIWLSLQRARKGHALDIQGTVQAHVPTLLSPPDPATPLPPLWLVATVRVNGNDAFPGAIAVDCGGSGRIPTPGSCTLAGNWWVDLDDEPRNLGKPVCVEMEIRDLAGSPGAKSASPQVALHVRMVKKR